MKASVQAATKSIVRSRCSSAPCRFPHRRRSLAATFVGPAALSLLVLGGGPGGGGRSHTFKSNLAMAFSTSVETQKSPKTTGTVQSDLWTDVAIDASKKFTVTQRQKLEDLGALDIERPTQIIGESLRHVDDVSLLDANSKIIHFQRHGQGYHNLICDMWRELGKPIDFDSTDPNLNPVVREEFLDPPLTALGVRQSKSVQEHCSKLKPEVVICSPLRRCLETAKLSFADHVGKVPWVAHEGCREELGLLVGNKRRPIKDIQVDHPDVDFSAMQHDDDVPWDNYGTERRETLLEKSERIYGFLTNIVRTRPEKEIAIVCHSAYLFTLLNAVMDIDDEDSDLRSWFLTAEVRSLKMTFKERDNENTGM